MYKLNINQFKYKFKTDAQFSSWETTGCMKAKIRANIFNEILMFELREFVQGLP